MPRRKRASHARSTPNRNPRDLSTLEDELFQEASSLSAATGAHIAVVSRRPSGEVRLWGYPSAQSVLNRYQQCTHSPSPPSGLVEADDRARLEHMRREDERNGTPPASEQIGRGLDWEIELLEREIERVQKRIAELDAESRGASPQA